MSAPFWDDRGMLRYDPGKAPRVDQEGCVRGTSCPYCGLDLFLIPTDREPVSNPDGSLSWNCPKCRGPLLENPFQYIFAGRKTTVTAVDVK